MKQNILTTYLGNLLYDDHGERYSKIFYYFFLEWVTSFVLYSLPFLIEFYFMKHLKSTPAYATLGTTNTLLHLLIKVAEAFSIGTVIVAGNCNGKGAYKDAGRALRDSFWLTFILGITISMILFWGAHAIYKWYGTPAEMIALGVPFLRLRAIGVFFTFVYFAFVGFLRGIKNAQTPMLFFIFGAVIFIFFDYALMFGKFGLPQLGLQGSAWASVIQYSSMCLLAFFYILMNKEYRKYSIELLGVWRDRSYMGELLSLSWPIILDKSTLAMAYIWLCRMIAPLGTSALASFCAIKDLERFAFLPAIACAQIITFLVSNDYSIGRWESIQANIKKIIFLASCMVCATLLFLCAWSEYILFFFDEKREFAPLAVSSFPIVSVLVFFDLVQLILSGALRGAGNVKTVMMVRLIICFGYFIPISYLILHAPIVHETAKFIMLYSSFYMGNALMSIVYIHRFRGDAWKAQSLQEHT